MDNNQDTLDKILVLLSEMHERTFQRVYMQGLENDPLLSQFEPECAVRQFSKFQTLMSELTSGFGSTYIRPGDWSKAFAEIFIYVRVGLDMMVNLHSGAYIDSSKKLRETTKQTREEIGLSALQSESYEIWQAYKKDNNAEVWNQHEVELNNLRSLLEAKTAKAKDENQKLKEQAKKTSLELFEKVTLVSLAGFIENMKMCESPLERAFLVGMLAYSREFMTPNLLKQGEVIELQKKIGNYRCDFVYTPNSENQTSEKPIVIEVDGHSYHEKSVKQATNDRQRDRFLADKGYKVLRFHRAEIEASLEEAIASLDDSINAHLSDFT